MSKIIEIAEQFGQLIVNADYPAAHLLLSQEAQKINSPETLKIAVEQMIAYALAPIQDVQVMSDLILEDWPAKQEKDVAIVYISLTGEGFCEAVTVTLAQEADHLRIRYLEWGRP
ncbi:MAG: hypothetical protein VKL42_01200 [Snowella sp.]|nr:hypothetical protein [Snowella sp.]